MTSCSASFPHCSIRRTISLCSLAVCLMAAVACGESKDSCEETSKTLAGAEEVSPLGFSLMQTLSGRTLISAGFKWENAPAWVQLKSTGQTSLTATVQHVGAPVALIEAQRNDFESNDPRDCSSRLQSSVTLVVATSDGALTSTFDGRWTAFEPNVVTLGASLRGSSLVGPDVQLSWDERIESGVRTGRLIAHREEKQGSSGSSIQVHTIAQWRIPDLQPSE